MSSQFNIVSRQGHVRADSDDGKTLFLRFYKDPHQKLASHAVVDVALDELRQIVDHFDWLQSKRAYADLEERFELVALNPQRFNVLVIHTPEGMPTAQVESIKAQLDFLLSRGVHVILAVPPTIKLEFGTQEQ